ncbi:DUF1206 domain-containing protein [Subtercola frigoramans]|uniref:Fucose permease n=1 Tax=Subtercola frigoramans TaxID=120298 RepID=A0ABS2L0K3_9MICO|nr:DUF1206 domain-containing protein [Subtercola frigoramans]MBM7470602.1 fucose permease [Subtercola frigoramans]
MRSVVSAAKAAAYLAVGWTALTTALGSATTSSSSSQHASASVFALPSGQIFLGLAGLVAAPVGIYFVIKGVRRKFLDDVATPPGIPGRAVDV